MIIFKNSSSETFQIICDGTEVVGNEIQLLPDGLVRSKKGDFISDEESRKAIIEYFNAHVNDAVIDYEHQTLDGVVAPAAGWIKELIDKGKEGLWAKVEWTQKGQEYIQNKEYRYLSPVVFVRKADKKAIVLHSAALTNTPAIDGMKPLSNKMEVDTLDILKELIKILQLPDTATEQDVIDAVKKLLGSGEGVALKALGLKQTATQKEVETAILALKNPTGFVPTDTYTIVLKENNDLKQKITAYETKAIKDTVQQVLKEGKILPAQMTWAEQYALKDPEGFKNWSATAPIVVPLDKIKDIKEPQSKTSTLDDTQISINKMLGLSDADFQKEWGDNSADT